MPTLTLHRRDPWWGLEGPAAKRHYRYQRFISTTAFLASVVALGGAGVIWAIQLGLAATFGFNMSLPIG